jgi:hypothetical protein
MIGAGIAALLAAAAAVGGVVNNDHRFLSDNIRPAVLDRAIWCWQDAAAKARISASESRRDEMVVRTALLGAERSALKRGHSASTESIANAIGLSRRTYRLGYIYAFFWPPEDRRRLFDYVAASRPICSASFGPLTRSAS